MLNKLVDNDILGYGSLTAKEFIDKLENSKHVHKIILGNENKTSPTDTQNISNPEKGSGSTITINPGDEWTNPNGGGWQRPVELALMHELIHSTQFNEGRFDNTREGGIERSEIEACRETNRVLLEGKANGSLTDLYTVLSAYLVLAESALNILRFYKLRRYLGRLRDDPLNILSKMKEIVLREIENSRLMTELCKADSRLGYHSEAEGYKFFPEKLEARAEKLKKLLQTEFPEVEQRIKEGLIPLEFYSGEAGPGDYIIEQSDITRAPWQYFAEGRAAVRFACVDGEMTVELKGENIAEEDEDSYRFVLLTEFEPMYPEGAVLIRSDGSWFADGEKIQHLGMSGSAARAARRKWNVSFLDEEKTHVRVSFSVKSVEPGQRYIKLSALVNGVSWQEDKFKVTTLGKQFVSPGQYKKIFFAREV